MWAKLKIHCIHHTLILSARIVAEHTHPSDEMEFNKRQLWLDYALFELNALKYEIRSAVCIKFI